MEGTVSPAGAITTVTATDAGGFTFPATPNATTGAFSLPALRPGSYILTFEARMGFLTPGSRTVVVASGSTASAGTVIVAAVPQGTITGTVTPANVVTRVELVAAGGAVTSTAPDPASGTFRFGGLALGTYSARFVMASGYTPIPDQLGILLSVSTPNASIGSFTAQPNTIALTATLSGSQEVPATPSNATGTFTGTYTLSTQALAYTITYSGMVATMGHIHSGRPGATGPVEIPFSSLLSPIVGTVTITPRQASALLNDEMYVNLHSATYPAGEIRGNIHR